MTQPRRRTTTKRWKLTTPTPDRVTVDLTVRATAEEIARLGTERAAAFLNGIADVLTASGVRR